MLRACLVRTRPLAHSRRLYSDSTAPTHNAELVEYLNSILQEEKTDPNTNQYRIRSLAHAIYSVQNASRPITSGKEALKLPRVGKGTADRIEMFLQGKKYGSEHEAAQRERFKLSKALQTIPGLGSRTADSLIAEGVTSLSDLRHPEYFRRLSPAQRIGLVYAKPLTETVSRLDAETVADFIRDHISPNFKVELMGAYRRELANTTSVSILLSHPSVVHVPVPSRAKPPPVGSGRTSAPFTDIAPRYSISPLSNGTKHESTLALAQDVVRPLEDVGLIAATLVSQTRRWQGVAALPIRETDGQWGNMGERLRDIRRRRGRFVSLTLSLAPVKSLGAARLFLTGDDDFLRAARTAAMRQGLLLNEYGLWRWVPGPHAPPGQIFPDRPAVGRGKTQWTVATRDEGLEGSWELLEAETEEDLLAQLGMGLVPPAKRNFMFLRPRSDIRAKSSGESGVVVPPEEVLDAMHEDLLESGGVFTSKVRKVGRPRKSLGVEVGGIREAKPRGRKPAQPPELPESPTPPDVDDFGPVN